MQKSDKDRILKMIEEGIFDARLLIICIAKLNKKIANKYRYVRISSKNCRIEPEIVQYEENLKLFNYWVDYRKTILDTLMKKYRISLEEMKRLSKTVKDEELPTYKMIDSVRERILSGKYICV